MAEVKENGTEHRADDINNNDDDDATKRGKTSSRDDRLWNAKRTVNVEELLQLNYHGIVAGNSFVYRAWQHLLQRWSQLDYDVYVGTPIIDKLHIEDIVKFFPAEKQRRLHIFTRKNDWSKTDRAHEPHRMWRDVEKLFGRNFGTVFRFFDPPVAYFHGKFVAGVPAAGRGSVDGGGSGVEAADDEEEQLVEVMMTSANFSIQHLGVLRATRSKQNHETVSFGRISKRNFEKDYLEQLLHIDDGEQSPK